MITADFFEKERTEYIILDLKTDFQNMVQIYNNINVKKTEIEEKISKFKDIYNELVKNNSSKVFLFCLDSLFFQYKLLNLEFENYHKTIALLQNRMYGDYYKLYNVILLQCKENSISLDISGNNPEDLPVYKDIDPFFKYKLEDITLVHERILSIIQRLDQLYNDKTENIKNHRKNIEVGFSLLIFIHTLEYEKDILKGQMLLYMNYMYFYHVSHEKYLSKLLKKLEDYDIDLNTNVLLNNDFPIIHNNLSEESHANEIILTSLEVPMITDAENIVFEKIYEEPPCDQPFESKEPQTSDETSDVNILNLNTLSENLSGKSNSPDNIPGEIVENPTQDSSSSISE